MTSDALPSIAEGSRREFEKAWLDGQFPTIESVLPPTTDLRFAATLEELVHLDLDFRWRRWAEDRVQEVAGELPLPLETYIGRFPALRRPEIICRLAQSEFEARQRAGQQPQVEEFVARLTQAEWVPDLLGLTISIGARASEPAPQQLADLLRRVLSADGAATPGNVTLHQDGDGTLYGQPSHLTFAWGGADGASAQFTGYQIIDRIAEGGMGVVFKARQVGLDRVVALKTIRSGICASDEELVRFRREAAAVAHLQHPNIVQIHEVGISGKQPFFSMEFVEGGSLAQRLHGVSWPSESAAWLLTELSAAMQYAHARGIVHRDLKPGNILLAARTSPDRPKPSDTRFDITEWVPKITDFGLAKQLDNAQDALTQSDALLGTPCYMSPEQAAGHVLAVGPASDIYALGAVLYELLVGRPPFKAETMFETIRQVCTREPRPPRQLNGSVAADLETICLKCLAKEPARRYADAGALHADLQRFREGLPIQARPVGRLERAVRWSRRNPLLCGLAISSVAAVLLLGLVFMLNRRASRLTALGDISGQFERQLEASTLATDDWDELCAFTDRVNALSPTRGAEAREKLYNHYAEKIKVEILRPRLDTAAAGRIDRAITSLQARSPALAEPLRKMLASRLRLTLFDFRAGDDSQSLFDPALVAKTPLGAVRNPALPKASSPDVLTSSNSSGNVELEATFAPGWEQSRQLALLLHALPAADGVFRGYRFELRTTTPKKAGQPTFAEARSQKLTAQVVLRRDSQTLKVVNVPAASLPTGELRLRARRDGNSLTFQVQELQPIVHDELFWSVGRNQGNFGLSLPAGAILTRLQATRPASGVSSSRLESGDALYSAGQFEAALANYELQYEQTSDGKLRDEITYKRALCLFELRHGDDAYNLLQSLILGKDRWSQLAGIQAWVWHIEQSQFAEADDIFDTLATRNDFVNLAAQIPLSTRDKMLRRYRDLVGVYGLRHNPNRIRNLNRARDLLEAVNAELWEISETRILLIDAYDRADQLEQARQHAEYLLGHPELSAEGRCRIVERMARLLVRQGEPGAALATIDQSLFSSPGVVAPNHEPILLTRAAFHGSQGDWQKAQQDVEFYFGLQLSDLLRNDPRAWLLRGLASRRCDGNDAQAKKFWAEGHRLGIADLNQDLYLTIVLGLVSETLTKDLLMKLIQQGTGNGFGSQAIEIVRKDLLLNSDVFAILSGAGGRARAFDFLERQQCFQLTGEERVIMGPRIVAHELFTHMIAGPPAQARQLSAEEDQVIWDFTQTLYDAYARGEFKESYLLPLLSAWRGQKLLGWDALKFLLTPECRGPLAYVLACHYERMGRKAEARDFLATAARDAPANSTLEQLVRDRQRLGTMAPLDLQPVANQPVREPLPGLGLGDQEFLGLRFHIGEREIQLGGLRAEGRPKRVEGIKVVRKVARLHFLHSVIMSARTENGAEVGSYEINYADGQTEKFSLILGDHLREHWFENAPEKTVNSGRIAWIGENDSSRTYGQKLCLCATSWTNPRPDVPIASLSYVSAMHSSGAAPFCVAITLEEAAAESATTPAGTK